MAMQAARVPGKLSTPSARRFNAHENRVKIVPRAVAEPQESSIIENDEVRSCVLPVEELNSGMEVTE